MKDAETIMQAYGPEYHWDRCGRLSPQCEMYFLYEVCMYKRVSVSVSMSVSMSLASGQWDERNPSGLNPAEPNLLRRSGG